MKLAPFENLYSRWYLYPPLRVEGLKRSRAESRYSLYVGYPTIIIGARISIAKGRSWVTLEVSIPSFPLPTPGTLSRCEFTIRVVSFSR